MRACTCTTPTARSTWTCWRGLPFARWGHSHPYLTKALQAQAGTLLHVSNLFLTEPQARLARRLVELSDFERVFFCNSGAESIEAAIKIARKYGRGKGGDAKTRDCDRTEFPSTEGRLGRLRRPGSRSIRRPSRRCRRDSAMSRSTISRRYRLQSATRRQRSFWSRFRARAG